mmetsp:Transcript_113752/g.197681  ORF Transcript_113752/g.197681 Transcript_113752/m.197681 type:complete len:96 (+) Transcript_113752:114-401(+)
MRHGRNSFYLPNNCTLRHCAPSALQRNPWARASFKSEKAEKEGTFSNQHPNLSLFTCLHMQTVCMCMLHGTSMYPWHTLTPSTISIWEVGKRALT